MDLKKAIKNCVSGKYSFRESRCVIDHAHTIALAYLRMKVVSGHLYSHKGELLEDLAWDFIAELFERNNEGSFVVLADFFSLSALNHSSGDEINQQFRRIIVTKVDDNIFRSNGEKDPSLKKIIRNLKNAVKNTAFEKSIEIKNGYISILHDNNHHDSGLLSPTDVLETELCSRIRETSQMPEILSEIVTILEDSRLVHNKLSLVAVAICIRNAFVHVHNSYEDDEVGEHPSQILHRQTAEKRIDFSAQKVKKSLGQKYVHKGVLTQNELDSFMLAVKEILRLELVDKHAEANHFDCLKLYHTEIGYAHYREQYRPVLEYLVKKTRAEIISFYEKEWG